MNLTRRKFLGTAGVAAGAPLMAGPVFASESNPQTQRLIEQGMRYAKVSRLKPPWRLSVDWYKATIGRLQAKLRDKNVRGILCTSGLNHNYLTGTFLTQTERPMYLFVPANGEPTFFHPGLDRDMVSSWWVKDHEWYFDYLHAGAFDNVLWQAGPTEDLWAWVCKGLAKRGHTKGRLALDFEPTESLRKKLKKNLKNVKWESWGEEVLHMRQVKTEEEIELTVKAIELHDAMLEFARNYILDRGTDATDYEVREATSEFGTRLLMEKLGPGELDGRPHKAVGLSLGFGCRTGRATAYPHPNQFFFKRIERGDAIQIASLIRIGGYGGEGYRACHIDPIPELGRKMWEVHTAMTLKQVELSKPGVKCNEVAQGVLKLAFDAGLEKYVYHRPAHGAGMEGHQAPYIALGDQTVLEEGMMFSNEPGLYNEEAGFGYNHSNNIRILKTEAAIMNKTPLTKDWCWLKL